MMDHKKSLYRFTNVHAVLMLVLMACNPHHYHSTAVAFAYTSGTLTRTHTPTHGPRSTITSIRSSKNNHTPTPHAPPPAPARHRHGHKDEKITKIPWLIIGGGIHGVHIATRLLGSQSGGMDPDPANAESKSNLCIVDAHEHLLHTWKSRTAATGMQYLRSSAGYHLDLDENSLRDQFGSGPAASVGGTGRTRKQKRKERVNAVPSFSKDYERPRLDVFNQHCDCVIEKYGLENLHIRGVVTAIEPHKDHVRVVVSLPFDNHDNNGNDNDNANDNDNDKHMVYNAEYVVLAMGNDDPSYAEWVNNEDVEQGLVHHLLEDKKTRVRNNSINTRNDASDTRTAYSVAVVGGGITAAHKALELAHDARTTNSNTKIHLISRHPLKEQQFDTHQDWMMDLAASKRSEEGGGEGIPKRQRLFSQSACWKERRRIIGRERVAGTVTPAVNRGARGLKYAIQKGDIQWHQAEVLKKCYIESKSDQSPSRPRMELSLSSGTAIEVDEILLATGFGKKLPGGTLLQNDLVEKAGLEVSEFCGFPIVDENLLWHSRIFVAGALAELELGPSARNIAGARLAAERIVRKARSMDPLSLRS